ncbi:pentatricopeptide repeat-containing family protein [Striga asiatica]|uniref:Pentatricopeptide repeat-containing family protein n=1 Tax=Striga asiatica TaxID=4170 RepID=A0A5A7QE66_STRAF|nr:pentatricopeptide repeat-containing family protein [Striga asiatica]
MLLQPAFPKSPSIYPNQNSTVYAPNVPSFSSGLLKNSTFFLKQSILSTSYRIHPKNPIFITCSSESNVHSYGTVDYEKKPTLKWNNICKKIFKLEKSNLGAASVLTQVENEGKTITKLEILKILMELRKFRRFKLALEILFFLLDNSLFALAQMLRIVLRVCEWMNNRSERFRVTTRETTIHLDLIAKVQGVSSAEQYFKKLPDALKDKRVYASLLNAYALSKMREKAESLFDKMRNRNYTDYTLPFNLMMIIYRNLKDHEKIESLVSEMVEKRISLDIYTYNIWLSACGSLDKMEQAFKQMELDNSVNPNWITYSTMAMRYIKSGLLEKAEEYLKKLEDEITGQNRLPYHHLINLYAAAGRKEEVYRVWSIYKASFVNIPNLAYHDVILALTRLDDTEGAEKMYGEWLSVKSAYDPRLGNLLLSSYVRKGLSEKAKTFFEQMVENGGKHNSMSWEILSEDHIANMRIPEALSCLKNAAALADEGSRNWKPKPVNVSKILKIVEEGDDVAGKESLLEILSEVGCLKDAAYMSYIPLSDGEKFAGMGSNSAGGDESDDGKFELLDQLQESF